MGSAVRGWRGGDLRQHAYGQGAAQHAARTWKGRHVISLYSFVYIASACVIIYNHIIYVRAMMQMRAMRNSVQARLDPAGSPRQHAPPVRHVAPGRLPDSRLPGASHAGTSVTPKKPAVVQCGAPLPACCLVLARTPRVCVLHCMEPARGRGRGAGGTVRSTRVRCVCGRLASPVRERECRRMRFSGFERPTIAWAATRKPGGESGGSSRARRGQGRRA